MGLLYDSFASLIPCHHIYYHITAWALSLFKAAIHPVARRRKKQLLKGVSQLLGVFLEFLQLLSLKLVASKNVQQGRHLCCVVCHPKTRDGFPPRSGTPPHAQTRRGKRVLHRL